MLRGTARDCCLRRCCHCRTSAQIWFECDCFSPLTYLNAFWISAGVCDNYLGTSTRARYIETFDDSVHPLGIRPLRYCFARAYLKHVANPQHVLMWARYCPLAPFNCCPTVQGCAHKTLRQTPTKPTIYIINAPLKQ